MWIVYVIASFLILLLFILSIPVDITIIFNTGQKPKFSANVKWLFGLYSSELVAKKKHLDQKSQLKPNRLAARNIIDILLIRGLFKQLFRLIRRIFRRMKVRELEADIKIGLENPADTGLLFAFLAPLNLLIRSYSPHAIAVQPDFSDETPIKGFAYSTARLQPIMIMAPLCEFILSKPGFTTMKKLLLVTCKEKG